MLRHFTACGLLLAAAGVAAASKEDDAKKLANDIAKSKDAKVRVAALGDLGKLGQLQRKLTEPYLELILKTLDDKETAVRAAAAYALGLVDPEDKDAAVARLVKMLEGDKAPEAREGAAKGLGAMGPAAKKAVPALRDAQKKVAAKKDGVAFATAVMAITGAKK